ncbi:MAG: hypothetical protein NTV42_02120 [Chloroflexi bacterium]|nr:hypothetical protein [Chloroflexota bacterium]
MQKPWMPVVAGLLDIVSGALGIIAGLFMSLRVLGVRAAHAAAGAAPGVGPYAGNFPQMPHMFFPGMGIAFGIALLVIGVLAIVGGVYALRLKAWGLALAGSIGAVITGPVIGLLALIFTVLGREDFRKP